MGLVMITFRCGQCDKEIKVKDDLEGKKGKCPGCGKPIVKTIAPTASPRLRDNSSIICRRRGSAMALKTSEVVAARGMAGLYSCIGICQEATFAFFIFCDLSESHAALTGISPNIMRRKESKNSSTSHHERRQSVGSTIRWVE